MPVTAKETFNILYSFITHTDGTLSCNQGRLTDEEFALLERDGCVDVLSYVTVTKTYDTSMALNKATLLELENMQSSANKIATLLRAALESGEST